MSLLEQGLSPFGRTEHLGNEQADRLAAFTSILGELQSATQTATEGGVREAAKAVRAEWRFTKGYWKKRTDWHRHALSAFTWMRTNRGPRRG